MGANGTVFTQTKSCIRWGVLKEIHSLIRDGTDRKRVNTYTKPTNTKCIKKDCIVLSNTIEKYLEIDTANHVAYATYATT